MKLRNTLRSSGRIAAVFAAALALTVVGPAAVHAEDPAAGPTHGSTPPTPEADPFTAPACEGETPPPEDLLVTGQQLENYNRGGIAVLYGTEGFRDDEGANPPGCGVRYAASTGGPVSEWMYCTDKSQNGCLNVQDDGTLEVKDGSEKVDPMEWLDGNSKLSAEQARVIAYILQNEFPVTAAPNGGATHVSNDTRLERSARQLAVWCVSDYVLFGEAGENHAWCNENMSAERQTEILTLVPEAPQLELSLSGVSPELPVGTTARLYVSTNLFNQAINLSAFGEAVTVCGGDATLTDGKLTVQGTDPNTPKRVERCVTGHTVGATTVTLEASPLGTKQLSWAQANHSADDSICQVFAAFERTRTAPVGALARLNFVDGVGTFSLHKELSGVEAVAFPSGTTFPVHATWEGGSETFDLPVDGTPVESGITLPEGTVVTLDEGELPDAPKGYSFESKQLSADKITILEDGNPNIEWSVTNTYDRQHAGGFDIAKKLTGIEADAFPRGTEFTVVATWTIEGEEIVREFSLPADGSVVAGPQDLPEGTTVTFREINVPSAAGYSHTGVKLSPETFTVTDSETVHVTAENSYRKNTIAATGSDGIAGLAIAGTVLLIAGAAATVARRRTRSA